MAAKAALHLSRAEMEGTLPNLWPDQAVFSFLLQQ
jgi:hypothetical protein